MILAAIGVIAAVIATSGFAPPFVIYVIGTIALIAVSPSPRELVRISREPGISLHLGALSLLLTAASVYDILRSAPFAGWPSWAVVATAQ